MSLKKYCTVAAAIAATLPCVTMGSSHREAPNITRLPTVDSTDFYLFNSYEPGREGYVTLLANYIPLQQPYGGPNYFAMDPAALYEIHIDNDGDAQENLTFQFRFTNRLANDNRGIKLNVGGPQVAVPLKNVGGVSATDNSALNFRESYQVWLTRGDRRKGNASVVTSANGGTTFGKPFDFVGTKTFGSVNGYRDYARSFINTINVPGCNMPGRVFVGQRKEGFAVNLGRVFDLVNLVPVEGDSAPGAGDGGGFPGGITQSRNNNTVGNANVTTIALELHKSCLTGSGNGVIGGWTSASLRQARLLNPLPTFSRPEVDGGPWVQVSRLGMPLVNELVIGLPDKDRFSASEPRYDGQFATYVTNPTLPALLDALFRGPVNQTLGTNIANLAPNNLPRNDLVTAFLTGFPGVNQLARVTPSEMARLNTGIPATPAAMQSNFGVAGGDLAGFPNGRRPGDDTVDVALRVVMGRLCYPLTIGGNNVDLGLCNTGNAPVGNVPFTDGAPVSAADFDMGFPYLATPLPGSGADMGTHKTNYSVAAIAATTLVVAACGGGSGGQPMTPAPMNAAPQIVAIADRSIDQDTTAGPIELSIADRESAASTLTVTAVADGASVFPADGVVIGGSDAARTLTLTPLEAATGVATITVRAVDPQGAASTRTFQVSVNARNGSMRTAALTTFAKSDSDDATSVNGVTYVQDADDPTVFEALLGEE